MLQLAEVLGRNRDVVQRTETSRHAVDRAADVFHLAIQIPAAFFDGGDALFREFERFVVVDDVLDPLQGEMGIGNDMGHGLVFQNVCMLYIFLI